MSSRKTAAELIESIRRYDSDRQNTLLGSFLDQYIDELSPVEYDLIRQRLREIIEEVEKELFDSH